MDTYTIINNYITRVEYLEEKIDECQKDIESMKKGVSSSLIGKKIDQLNRYKYLLREEKIKDILDEKL